jgi:hypothetical protein
MRQPEPNAMRSDVEPSPDELRWSITVWTTIAVIAVAAFALWVNGV